MVLPACDHKPFTTPDRVFTVDDPASSDPMLVVYSKRRTANELVEVTRFASIVGELDTYSAALIAPVLARWVSDSNDLVIDTSHITFIDSQGLRVLEELRNRAAAQPGKIFLHEPSPTVRRLIALLGFADELDLCPTDGADTRPSGRVGTRRRSPAQSRGQQGCNRDLSVGHRRIVELRGGRQNPDRLRLTIDVHTTATTRHQGRTLEFVVDGELDAEAATIAQHHVPGITATCTHVVADLSGVTVIDSAGTRLIEQLAADATASGASFAVRRPPPIVHRVLDTLGVAFDPAPLKSGAATGTYATTSIHH